MTNYLKRIEDIIVEVDRFVQNSEIIYIKSHHEEIIDMANQLFFDISKDSDLKKGDKMLLLSILTTVFKIAKIEMANFFEIV